MKRATLAGLAAILPLLAACESFEPRFPASADVIAQPAAPAPSSAPSPAPVRTAEEVIASSPATDWRAIKPENLMLMQLPSGRVAIELAPEFAPNHVANIRTMAREHYYDGLAIIRLQEGFVAQWGDPDEDKPKSFGAAKEALTAEFARKTGLAGLPFTPWPDRDTYAATVGFVNGMPAAFDARTGEAWLTHCTATVAVARGNSPDSGSGGQLFAVIAQPARRLDRNLTVVGRVIEGYELLARLKPGTQAMGFYAPEDRVPITSVRMASDLAASERPAFEALRTDSETFATLASLRRTATSAFYAVPTGAVELCNAPLRVREAKR